MTISANTDESEIDPVCGMTVTAANAYGWTTVADRHYYFCSKKCHDKFVAAPQSYINKRSHKKAEIT